MPNDKVLPEKNHLLGREPVTYETILLENKGGIGKLTFNRPDVLNAYNKVLAVEIIEGFKELIDDVSVKVIVITGAGKAFMAGADINMINDWCQLGDAGLIKEKLSELLDPNIFEDCSKPTVAAVNGLAFGMGCELAMACDFRIAAESAKFALPEIKIGLIPGGGGSQRMLNLVGATRALEIIATGDPIDAGDALRIGLVNQVVSREKLWEAVEVFVARLADKSPIGLATCKKLIYQGGNLPIREGLRYERDRFCEILLSEDASEGTKAFLEKRKPVFKGK
jgi:enoyl-CoA hydratase/carnithine racemase